MWARIPTSFAQRPPGTFSSPVVLSALLLSRAAKACFCRFIPQPVVPMPGFGSRRPRRRPTDSDDEAPPLSPAEQAAASRTRALRMLERRSYSEAELTRRLKEKGDAPEIAEVTVQKMVAAGFVNDGVYARQVARSFLVSRRASVRRTQQEMMRRGVARPLADEAIAEVRADEDTGTEDESVERAARKKLKSLAGLDATTRYRRLTAFLARRGFSGDIIRAAIRRIDKNAEEDVIQED